jgi:hypothetical protein
MTEKAARVGPLPVWRRRRYANAYCPLCGAEQLDRRLAKLANREAALCLGRCATAWQALGVLRTWESGNEALATRRQLQWEADRTQAASLSELLLERWRAGDWTVVPEDLLRQLLATVCPDPSQRLEHLQL